jgi:predicted metal-dependent phosphoesterase TrpH
MGIADLHIHSIHSLDGTASIPAILKYAADRTPLDALAITDHNSMDGVLQALELAPRYGLTVIPGCEVSTTDGHLLTLFVQRPVQPGLSLIESVLQVRRMNGLCIAAHPHAVGIHSLSFEKIATALQVPGVAETLVGIETYNGCLLFPHTNAQAAVHSAELGLSAVGGSDAHHLAALGQGRTKFIGRSANDLYLSLKNRQTAALAGPGWKGLGVLAGYLPSFALRQLGWARWNAAPALPLRFERLSRLFAGQPIST